MAGGRFAWGFKTEAERQALELRAEIGLSPLDRLDALALARHLSVPVFLLSELRQANPVSIRHFTKGPGRGDFSAVTVYVTRYQRIILVNSAHSYERQMSSLCHEISHIVLGHESETPVGLCGKRDVNRQQEDEADWLSGCLLIPGKAALVAARRGLDDAAVADRYSVSIEMARMRMNVTGARLMAQRSRTVIRRAGPAR